MNDAKYISLTHRITEETQLLAEEKWIIEAINKIKTQRNCLKIEQFELSSMKRDLLQKIENKSKKEFKMSDPPKAPTPFSLVNIMIEPKAVVINTPTRRFLEVENSCNTEQLNLGVTKSVFSQKNSGRSFVTEDDEESEDEIDCDDELDSDNLLLDMNMFMNCTRKQ